MTVLVTFCLLILAVINVAIILVPYLYGKAPLLTIRNFFLVGFTLYQVTSGAISLYNLNSFTSEIILSKQDQIASTYLLWVVIFEIVFLCAYRWGFGSKRLASWTPIIRGHTREPILWLFAFCLLGVALVLRVSILVPYVSILTSHIGTSVAAVAAGLGAWIWIRRPFNPAAAGVMFIVLFLAIAIGITGVSVFGRRPIVAIAGCLTWGMYYSRAKDLRPSTVMLGAAVFGLIPIVLVAKFTTVRGTFPEGSSPFTRISMIAQADTMTGVIDIASGQECAAWSMHLMEMYPEYHDYRHMHAIKYFFQFPVPRVIYPTKPEALASIAWRDADLSGKPEEFTIGPGIVGHAAAEGGFYALIVYAIALGLFIRYFDAVLDRSPSQPFVVLPIGASLGNLIGIPRGETPNFAFEFAIGVVGSFVILIFVARLLKLMGLITDQDFTPYDPDEEAHDDHYDDPQYHSYGSEPDPN